MIGLVLAVATLVTPLSDPDEERRARALEQEIRCVVCENEPISQSTADIAADMRRMVRARIAAGDADDEVRSYFRARYGDFVLLRPRHDAATAALWASPILLALIAIGAALLMRRGRISEGLAPDLEPDDR